MNRLGLSIHIPFCLRKCVYCDFLSAPELYHSAPAYFHALKEEIRLRAAVYPERAATAVDTVFIGGGTPSSVPSAYLQDVLHVLRTSWNILPEAEITIEANPGTVSFDQLRDYLSMGINRLSLGIQAMDDPLLKALGRIHRRDQALSALSAAIEAGFRNVNADLIFGIPGICGIPPQTAEQFYSALRQVISQGVTHLSAYSMIVEPQTALYSLMERGEMVPCDEEAEREMYHQGIEILEKAGFFQYEISNFARQGMECAHNKKYWQCDPYLGFGLGAASCFRLKETGVPESAGSVLARTTNNREFSSYLEGKWEGETERLTRYEEMQEFMMLGFRMRTGPSPEGFQRKFATDYRLIFRKELDKLMEKGLVEAAGQGVRLTEKGLDYGNLVFMEFV